MSLEEETTENSGLDPEISICVMADHLPCSTLILKEILAIKKGGEIS
jgi:hypothetical protein